MLSANYPAREYGIKKGMSVFRSRRLCPQVKIVYPDLDTYAAVSRGIFAIFDSITPWVEAICVDEAFLDITGSDSCGGFRQLAERLRSQIAEEQRISCAIGIGPNRFIAKLASKQVKPTGVLWVKTEEIPSFLHPLPITELWGVGQHTAEKLHRFGLSNIQDLAYIPKQVLQRILGNHQGELLSELAWGRDPRSWFMPESNERSIGMQKTFDLGITDIDEVVKQILCISDWTAIRIRARRLLGRVITLSVQLADFSVITRSISLPSPTDETNNIYQVATGLFLKLNLLRRPIRKIGVRLGKLVPRSQAYQQPKLDESDSGWRQVEAAVDKAIRKFGPCAVQRAKLIKP